MGGSQGGFRVTLRKKIPSKVLLVDNAFTDDTPERARLLGGKAGSVANDSASDVPEKEDLWRPTTNT